jgi:hypothetical protein
MWAQQSPGLFELFAADVPSRASTSAMRLARSPSIRRYFRNETRAAAAVAEKYSGGSTKPHPSKVTPLVSARR